jgi:hypothetical protein
MLNLFIVLEIGFGNDSKTSIINFILGMLGSIQQLDNEFDRPQWNCLTT